MLKNSNNTSKHVDVKANEYVHHYGNEHNNNNDNNTNTRYEREMKRHSSVTA